MEWLERFNRAVDYIEENLEEEICLEEAARIACCSVFHFQRIFSHIADVPLSRYIRQRRMTLAAARLQSGEQTVLDTGLRFGYSSPTAFNRAFRGVHGISPAEARKPGVSLKAHPRIHFTIMVRGDVEMNYRIEKREAFRVAGVRETFPVSVEESFQLVPEFWQKTVREGKIPEILALMDGTEPAGLLGISACMEGETFDYLIAVATGREPGPGLETYPVPAATWAIFECQGPMPEAIQTLQKRIITEWLPSSGYEYANAPDIEVYFEGDQGSPDYRSQVWLPVVEKN